MKKLILILCLCVALTLCFVACDKKSDAGALSETPASEDSPSKDFETQDNISELNNADLIAVLVEYLKNIYAAYDMLAPSYAITINDIKNGDQPLLVQFNPEEFYFVCGYYNVTDDQLENEKIFYSNVEEYIWVKFENANEIREFYKDKKFIVAFQINKSLFVKDILSDNVSVSNVEHFSIYETEFSEEYNINVAVNFEKSLIYLNSSNKPCVYYSDSYIKHNLEILPCVELDGEYYISVWTHTVRENGDVTYSNLEAAFEKYYDDLIEIMQTDKYSETKSEYVHYYGLFDIEEFVDAVLE